MLPLRYSRRWMFAGALAVIGVFALALVPPGWFWVPRRATLVAYSDKWAHAAAFFVLALWFSGQYARRYYWRLALALIAFGIAIELCQKLTAHRAAEWMDLAADVLGVVFGLSMAFAGLGGWSLRVEQWIARRRAEA